MLETREVHINDVIAAFQDAKRVAGMEPALDVVQRFGARYVATIPPIHWLAAFHALNALRQSDDLTIETRPASAPERVRAGWRKVIAAA
jgi:hypothetical protein